MTDWKLKVQAYLYGLPEAAGVAPDEQDHVRDRLLMALGLRTDSAVVAAEASGLAGAAVAPRGTWARGAGEKRASGNGLVLAHPRAATEGRLDAPRPTLDGVVAPHALSDIRGLVPPGGLADGGKALFLSLWRLLPDLLVEQDPVWGILPAGPDSPSHSFWDHAATASAIAGTYDGSSFRPALLVFTIASVQDFVTAARRTQDLWMGSFLFSYLMWQAMVPIVDVLGPDAIIMPDLRGQPLVDQWFLRTAGLKHEIIGRSATDPDRVKIASLPNVLTAIVPQDQVGDLAERAEKALHEAKEHIGNTVKQFVEDAIAQATKAEGGGLESFAEGRDRTGWEDAWKRQLEDCLQANVLWAAYPWDAEALTAHQRLVTGLPHPDHPEIGAGRVGSRVQRLAFSYPVTSELVGRLLASRKNLRPFHQVPEPGHKCSQCGLREALSLTVAGEDDYSTLVRFWTALQRVGEQVPEAGARKRKLCGRIRRGDRLCAVCLTKRLAWEAFFLETGGLSNAFSRNRDTLPGHLLFPSTASIATAPFKERVLMKLRDVGTGSLEKSLREYVEAVAGFLERKHRNFPSAGIPKLERLAASICADAPLVAPNLIKAFLRLDGDWLYAESFEPVVFEREQGLHLADQERTELRNVQRKLEDLLSAAAQCGIPGPRRYYAVLVMDGDNFGQWLLGGPPPADQPDEAQSGENAASMAKGRRRVGPSYHRAVSGCLKDFALELVQPLVEDVHGGKLVYAGGDDLLALLPLDGLLGAMRDLRRLYAGVPSEVPLGQGRVAKVGVATALTEDGGGVRRWLLLPGAHDPHLPQAHRVTISAGAAVAHVTHPLWHAVEEAMVALKHDAKGRHGGNRDAWAVRILKRSGEPQHSVGKWSYPSAQAEFDVLEHLDAVTSLFRSGLSPRFLYSMRAEARAMSGLPVEAMKEEVNRLLQRREGLTDEASDTLRQLDVPSWFEHLCEATQRATDSVPTPQWETVMWWLYLAQFLARESGEA